jgi:hypothetical protein
LAEATTPAQVLTALEALSNINPGDVFVSGQTQNEKQTVTVTGDPFTLTFDGEPTEPIDDSVNAGFVKAALQRLPNIGSGGCAVAGPSGGPFVVEFTGPLAGTNVAQMTGTNVTVETVIAGSTGSPFTVTFQGQYETVDVPALTATNATIETVQPGTPDLGVKLVANTALLALDELIYDVEFDVPDDTDNDLDDNRKILPFAISADVAANATINLATVERLPHRSELGI